VADSSIGEVSLNSATTCLTHCLAE
jgi:hypothetical protein